MLRYLVLKGKSSIVVRSVSGNVKAYMCLLLMDIGWRSVARYIGMGRVFECISDISGQGTPLRICGL